VNNYITNRQIAFLLFLTLTSYSVVDIARAMAASAGYGSWLTILVASLLFAFIGLVIISLNYRFKGDMICDYSKKLTGNFISIVITMYYIFYFFLIVVFLNTQLSSILEAEFIPRTPRAVTMAVSIPIFCFIAYKGVITVGRLVEYYGLIYLIIMAAVFIIMLTQESTMRIRPFFNEADAYLYFQALREAIFPFLGIEILLVIPLSHKNGKSVKTTVFLAIISIGLFYALVVESTILKLGMNDIMHYNNSAIVAIRDMELSFLNFLKRLDVLFLTVGFSGFFMGISVVYTAILELLSKLIPKAKRWLLIMIIGVISFILAMIVLESQAFTEFVLDTGRYLGLIAALVIPITLLILSKVKKYV